MSLLDCVDFVYLDARRKTVHLAWRPGSHLSALGTQETLCGRSFDAASRSPYEPAARESGVAGRVCGGCGRLFDSQALYERKRQERNAAISAFASGLVVAPVDQPPALPPGPVVPVDSRRSLLMDDSDWSFDPTDWIEVREIPCTDNSP